MPKDFVSFVDDTSSDYKLVYEEHPNYFFACVEALGLLSDKLRHEYKKKMAAQIGKRKYSCVMIKRDVPMTSSAVDLLAVIYKVRDWQVRLIRYAFVDVNPEHLSSYKLATLYAHSRGFELEVFGDMRLAEKWLLARNCRPMLAPK